MGMLRGVVPCPSVRLPSSGTDTRTAPPVLELPGKARVPASGWDFTRAARASSTERSTASPKTKRPPLPHLCTARGKAARGGAARIWGVQNHPCTRACSDPRAPAHPCALARAAPRAHARALGSILLAAGCGATAPPRRKAGLGAWPGAPTSPPGGSCSPKPLPPWSSPSVAEPGLKCWEQPPGPRSDPCPLPDTSGLQKK